MVLKLWNDNSIQNCKLCESTLVVNNKKLYIQLPICKISSFNGGMLYVEFIHKTDIERIMSNLDQNVFKNESHLKSVLNGRMRLFINDKTITLSESNKNIHWTDIDETLGIKAIIHMEYIWNGNKIKAIHWVITQMQCINYKKFSFISDAIPVPSVPPPPPSTIPIKMGGPPPPPPPPPPPMMKTHTIVIKKGQKNTKQPQNTPKPPSLSDILNMKSLLKKTPPEEVKQPVLSIDDEDNDDDCNTTTPFSIFKNRLMSIFT